MKRWMLCICLVATASHAATTQKHYYAHDAVLDRYGVIAPWYKGQNGQLDYRVRIAAETLKRYPWTDAKRAVAALPEYIYSSLWNMGKDGTITVPPINDWANGDLGQRSAYVLSSLVDYYAYSGDPAAIAHVTWCADYLIDYCQTPADHPWPGILISVPTKGKAYGRCDPKGHIQLDIVSEVGLPLLRAYQITGNKRWFDAAKNWGDLLAAKRSREPGAAPWPRYANPEDTPWPTENRETGGIAFHLYFLDELIRLGYKGKDNAIVAARDAGRAYLRDVLLPKWTTNDTWGINYWDWPSPVQLENVTEFAARYMMDHKDCFPNWRCDVRNILSLFLNHTSVDPGSGGEVYNGAWAYPESCGCCGRSLWYGPMEVSWPFAQYGVEAESKWAAEIARRSQILATYDIHETGYSEDNIDGGQIVNAGWFKIAHPMALKHMLATIGWLPETFAPSRENHIVRSTSVITHVVYEDGLVDYRAFDAPRDTRTVLRLTFEPTGPLPGTGLAKLAKLTTNGYTVKKLSDGDFIVTVRHDGRRSISIRGDDPQKMADDSSLKLEGTWTVSKEAGALGGAIRVASESGASAEFAFNGNQVRLIGPVGPDGGLAEVYLDGAKQLAGIDFWNPSRRSGQVVYYSNGLANGPHTLKMAARGAGNPYSRGTNVYADAVQWSDSTGSTGFGEGGGPKEAQRWIFGYPSRRDYKDSNGNLWRPATEFVVRLGAGVDSVEKSWWTTPVTDTIENTKDQELYRYGVHAPEFTANFTVGPGTYYVRLKLAATRGIDTKANPFAIAINGREVATNLDVAATAGGPNRAVDLVFNGIRPGNGVIDIRFTGTSSAEGSTTVRRDAFVQAIEVGPGDGGKGVPR